MEKVRKGQRTRSQSALDPWISIRAAAQLLGWSQLRTQSMAMRKEFGRPMFAGGRTYVNRRLVEAYAAAKASA